MNTTSRIVFRDRKDAGEQLGWFLAPKYKLSRPIILGVARGGMQVANQVARILEAELEMVIAKKMPHPGREQKAIGAIAEDLSVYVSLTNSCGLDPEQIVDVIDAQTDEINRRISVYRQGGQFPDLKGRTVIIVDDGIATGMTLVPVLALCRKKLAGKVIIAVPVCGNNYGDRLDDADHLEILVKPQWFYAVAQCYATFRNLSEEDFLEILRKNKNPVADLQRRCISHHL